jgi:uncharacterized protein (TIGR00369 family)
VKEVPLVSPDHAAAEEPVTDPAALERLVALMPFAVELGLRLRSVSKTEVVGELDWAPNLCTTAGLLHGGVLMSFADSLGAVCAFGNLPEGARTATIESKTNLFRGVRGATIVGTSTPLHVGRTNIVVQTDVRDDRGKRVVLVTQTQAVIPAGGA